MELGRRRVGRLMEPSAVEPDQVAQDLLTAMEEGRFLVLPHPEVGQMYRPSGG